MHALPLSKKSDLKPSPVRLRLPAQSTRDGLERDADRKAEEALAKPRDTGSSITLRPVGVGQPIAATTPAWSSAAHVIPRGGEPMEHTTRRDMEQRFGDDFSHVRVHTSVGAAQSASDLHAQAYTFGSDIVFGAGQSPSNQRLLAHELAHVIQQARTGPMLLRKPLPGKPDPAPKEAAPTYPQWRPADAVLELRWVSAERWSINLSARISVKSARALIWPGWISADVAPMVLEVALLEPLEIGLFTISGLKPWHLDYMEPSIAALFRERGLVDPEKQSPELVKARAGFYSNNEDLADWVFDYVHRALVRATRGNSDLMIAFYEHYSSHDFEKSRIDDFGSTSSGDTEIKESVMLLDPRPNDTDDPLSLLGATLIHEFAHAPHGPRELGGNVTQIRKEAKAYAIESLFAERMGDKTRADLIDRTWQSNDSVIKSMKADKVYIQAYRIISALYKIIDSKGGAEGAAARRMSVEFISRNEADYGPDLRAFISNL